MRFANLIASHMRDDLPFKAGAGPNGGDFFLPWPMLQERFAAQGIALHTPDINQGKAVEFELHLNVQRHVRSDAPCFAYMYEDPLVRPINADRRSLGRYRKVWTWDETLIDGQRFIELEYPNSIEPGEHRSWTDRDLYCVMLASNKPPINDSRGYHQRRVDTIRYFERHASTDFHLYGKDWDLPQVSPGSLGRLARRLRRARNALLPTAPAFPSWRGWAHRKRNILERARFAICFENCRGNPGYITEKIFDCFTAGCVPVYAGSPHRTAPVPPECFIDADQFSGPGDILVFLRSIDAGRFAQYQNAIKDFLRSEACQRYSNEHWCDTLVDGICASLREGQSAVDPIHVN